MYYSRLSITTAALACTLYAQGSFAALQEQPRYTVEMASVSADNSAPVTTVATPVASTSIQTSTLTPAPENSLEPTQSLLNTAPTPVAGTRPTPQQEYSIPITNEHGTPQPAPAPMPAPEPAQVPPAPVAQTPAYPAPLPTEPSASLPPMQYDQPQQDLLAPATPTAATSSDPVLSAPTEQKTSSSSATERIQEVTLPLGTTFDNTIMTAFQCLQQNITLGLGQTKTLPLNIIAGALRGYTLDNEGNISFSFSLNAAERILHEQGYASWIGLSNPILIWLNSHDSINGQENQQLISGQNLTLFAQNLLNAAPTYKYRLMFPLLDLEDIQKISTEDVISAQGESLKEASLRYGADYFIAASFENTAETGLSFTWNLFNSDGSKLATSQLSGSFDEVASLATGDIARALMNAQQQDKSESDAISPFGSADIDIDTLGQGDGFIRMKINDIKNLRDLALLRETFIIYGFSGDLRIIGYNSGAIVVELLTNSDATNFQGTISHSGDFSLLAPWTYSFNAEAAKNRPAITHKKE